MVHKSLALVAHLGRPGAWLRVSASGPAPIAATYFRMGTPTCRSAHAGVLATAMRLAKRNIGKLTGLSALTASSVVEEPDARCSFCQAPQNLGGRMLNCCGNVQYCDRKCQKRHWKLHKTICTLRGAPPAPAYAFHKSISSRLATGEILQILGSDCLETISAALLEHASAEDKPHVEESAIGADAILEDDSSADGIRPRHIRA